MSGSEFRYSCIFRNERCSQDKSIGKEELDEKYFNK
jgi:hypothetical protein